MQKSKGTIRRERPADYAAVEQLTREAFWNVYRPGCMEHYVVHVLRDDPAFVPELDLVLEREGQLIGHVLYMRAQLHTVDGCILPVMTFGPISIHPDFQGQGYGAQLLEASMEWAKQMGGRGPVHRGKPCVLWPFRVCSGQCQGDPLPGDPGGGPSPLFPVQGAGRRLSGGLCRGVPHAGRVFCRGGSGGAFRPSFSPEEEGNPAWSVVLTGRAKERCKWGNEVSPQKIGKNHQSYAQALSGFKMALAGIL